jgi:hypothetical protein
MFQGRRGGVQREKPLIPERKMAGKKIGEGTQEGSEAWTWI